MRAGVKGLLIYLQLVTGNHRLRKCQEPLALSIRRGERLGRAFVVLDGHGSIVHARINPILHCSARRGRCSVPVKLCLSRLDIIPPLPLTFSPSVSLTTTGTDAP